MSLESRYRFVDQLPGSLFDAVVNNAHGPLRSRTESIMLLRGELLSGRLPRPEMLAWPEEPLRSELLATLDRSAIVRYCDADTWITDDVLLRILSASHRAQRQVDEILAEWSACARERGRRTRTVGLIPGGDRRCDEVLLDAEAWQRARRDAMRLAAEVAAEAAEAGLSRAWDEKVRDWTAVREILDDLCEACDAGRDRRNQLLRSIDWRHSIELRKILAGIPAMGELVRALGRRAHAAQPTGDDSTETIHGPIRRPIIDEATVREVGTVETRGVERSNEVARMLASEAVLRTRPTTKLLWHARRAERALLTYHADSVVTNRIVSEQSFREGLERRHTRAERGPIIVILDTSGSMQGASETLAKAAVLQSLCVAELEQRPVYVYNFSGVGELAEHELSLEGEALANALAFLSLSFTGATEIDEAIRRAMLRLDQERWAYADILLVTDGFLDDPGDRFDSATLRLIDTARERHDFRFHVALTVAPQSKGIHDWGWEDGSTAPSYVGDPHWAVKEMADQLHDLSAWIEKLRPVN